MCNLSRFQCTLECLDVLIGFDSAKLQVHCCYLHLHHWCCHSTFQFDTAAFFHSWKIKEYSLLSRNSKFVHSFVLTLFLMYIPTWLLFNFHILPMPPPLPSVFPFFSLSSSNYKRNSLKMSIIKVAIVALDCYCRRCLYRCFCSCL